MIKDQETNRGQVHIRVWLENIGETDQAIIDNEFHLTVPSDFAFVYAVIRLSQPVTVALALRDQGF